MGALMRSTDWSQTPIGPVCTWVASLRTSLSICLSSRFPMILFWGPNFVQFYNDAYRPIQGSHKHPYALGKKADSMRPELWEKIGPILRNVFETGVATWLEDQVYPLERNGYLEEAYFTLSQSPIRDEEGNIQGIFCAVTETTKQILSDRRLRTLRDIASQASQVRSWADAYEVISNGTKQKNHGIRFSLHYQWDTPKKKAQLMNKTGLGPEAKVFSLEILLEEETDNPLIHALREVCQTREAVLLEDHEDQWNLPVTEWGKKIRQAIVLPLQTSEPLHLDGFLIIGINPHRILDRAYREFLNSLTGLVTTALHNAHNIEKERKQNQTLAELDKAKTIFFNNVSHEFRTPITLILGQTEDLLQQGIFEASPKDRQQVLSMLHRNALRLMKLVNSLLDISRIEAGRMEPYYEAVDLAALTTDLVSVFRSSVEKAGLFLKVTCEPPHAPGYIDKDMWEKMVLNLLSNAFKFTLSGGISVHLHALENSTELEVLDTGIGIPIDELPHLFTRFHRVPNAKGRTQEGSGIGLALVKELVTLHGGTIEVKSRENEGSIFKITLPKPANSFLEEEILQQARRSTAIGAIAFQEEAMQWAVEEAKTVEHWLDAKASYPSNSDRSDALHKVLSPSTARILLIDDNADMRDYIKRLLETYWQVEVANDGYSALASIEQQLPDLILSDIMMPGLDGFELVKNLRNNPVTQTIPIILLSARAGEESVYEGLDKGADDYLIKPFTARELLSRVNAHLKMENHRKQAQALLSSAHLEAEYQRSRLYTLLMDAPALICILKGPELIYEFANRAYQKTVGQRELLHRSIREVLPELEELGLIHLMENVYQTGQAFTTEEFRISFSEEQNNFYAFTFQPMYDAREKIEGLMIFAFDVSIQINARREAEKISSYLEKQKHVLELVAQGAALEKILETLAHILEEQSPGGLASILLLEKDGLHLRHGVAPNLPENYYRAIDGLPIGNLSGSCGMAAYTGKAVIVSDIATDPLWTNLRELALTYGLKACWSIPILSSHGKLLGTFAMYYRESRMLGIEELKHMGILTHTAAIAIERKQAQEVLHETEAQLFHSQKMDAIGQMAGGIAHEFNNLLTAINGYTGLLSNQPLPWMTQRSYLEEVRKAGDRAASLTRQLLAFGRKQLLSPKILNLNDILYGMRKMLSQVIGETIDLQLNPQSTLGRVKADPGQIEQVILTLALNARDAMPYGGKLILETSNLELHENSSLPSPSIPFGNYVLLRVSDTGIGMDEKTKTRIFEPFFTTKEVGKGTGLGLSMVDGIIKQSEGYIEVQSTPGYGTIFEIYFPFIILPSIPEIEKEAMPSLPVTKGQGTILVVEDEKAVRRLIYHMLKLQGYSVLEAASAQEAILLHERLGEESIQLLLTDVVMSNMGGRQLVEYLQPLRPNMKVLYMSGYTEDSAIHDSLKQKNVNFIGKPFSPETLAKKIHEILSPIFASET